jgi:hypothetical protein
MYTIWRRERCLCSFDERRRRRYAEGAAARHPAPAEKYAAARLFFAQRHAIADDGAQADTICAPRAIPSQMPRTPLRFMRGEATDAAKAVLPADARLMLFFAPPMAPRRRGAVADATECRELDARRR